MDEYKSGWAARAANEPDDEIIRSGQSSRNWSINLIVANYKTLRTNLN